MCPKIGNMQERFRRNRTPKNQGAGALPHSTTDSRTPHNRGHKISERGSAGARAQGSSSPYHNRGHKNRGAAAPPPIPPQPSASPKIRGSGGAKSAHAGRVGAPQGAQKRLPTALPRLNFALRVRFFRKKLQKSCTIQKLVVLLPRF